MTEFFDKVRGALSCYTDAADGHLTDVRIILCRHGEDAQKCIEAFWQQNRDGAFAVERMDGLIRWRKPRLIGVMVDGNKPFDEEAMAELLKPFDVQPEDIFGPTCCTPYADEQFPVQAAGEFSKQGIPDVNGVMPTPNPTYKALSTIFLASRIRQLHGVHRACQRCARR
jgi:hypothetical protein